MMKISQVAHSFFNFKVFEKYFILTKLGYAKDGRIVKYNHFAITDFRGTVFQIITSLII